MDFMYSDEDFEKMEEYMEENFDSSEEGRYFRSQYIDEMFGSWDDYINEYNNHEIASDMRELGFDDYDEYREFLDSQHNYSDEEDEDDIDEDDLPF